MFIKNIVMLGLCLLSATINAQESKQFTEVRSITNSYLYELNNYVIGIGNKQNITKLFVQENSQNATPVMAFYGQSLSIGLDELLLDYKTRIVKLSWDRSAIDPFYDRNNTLKTKVSVTYTYYKEVQNKASLTVETVDRYFEFKEEKNTYKIVSILDSAFITRETENSEGVQLLLDKQSIDFGGCEKGSINTSTVIIDFGRFQYGDKFTIEPITNSAYSVYFRDMLIKTPATFTINGSSEKMTLYFKPEITEDLTYKIIVKRGDKSEIITLNGRLQEEKREVTSRFNEAEVRLMRKKQLALVAVFTMAVVAITNLIGS